MWPVPDPIALGHVKWSRNSGAPRKERVMKLVAVLIGLACTMPLVAQQQSLGDLAKLAAQAKLKTPPATPTKVYTNADLLSEDALRPAPAPPTTVTPSTDDKTMSTSAVKDETYWKERMRALVAQRDNDITQGNAAYRLVGSLMGVRTPFLLSEQARAIADLGRWTAQIQNDKRAISDLEEEARRAGVPPGWLRW